MLLPPLATLAGLVLGLVGAAELAHPRALVCLVAGQLCALGARELVRRLDAASDAGAALAWVADCAVAYALAWALPWGVHVRVVCAVWAVVAQVAATVPGGLRVSGRTVLSLVATLAVVERLRGHL